MPIFNFTPLTTSDILLFVYVVATIILVWVTIKSTRINFLLLKKTYNPKIIVYEEWNFPENPKDPNAGYTVLVKNIGNGVAKNLLFKTKYNVDLLATISNLPPEQIEQLRQKASNNLVPLQLEGLFNSKTLTFCPGEHFRRPILNPNNDIDILIIPIEINADYENEDGDKFHDTYYIYLQRYISG